LQYRETVDMAITNAIGDDEKRQQTCGGRGARRKLAVAAACSELERFKTFMVARAALAKALWARLPNMAARKGQK